MAWVNKHGHLFQHRCKVDIKARVHDGAGGFKDGWTLRKNPVFARVTPAGVAAIDLAGKLGVRCTHIVYFPKGTVIGMADRLTFGRTDANVLHVTATNVSGAQDPLYNKCLATQEQDNS